jgi:hypothetical protein
MLGLRKLLKFIGVQAIVSVPPAADTGLSAPADVVPILGYLKKGD